MAVIEYLNIDIVVEDHDGEFYVNVINSPAGQARQNFLMPFTEGDLEDFYLQLGRIRKGIRRIDTPEMQMIKHFGGKLFRSVFADDVYACYQASLHEARLQGKGLRLLLRINSLKLNDLPWEFLYDKRHNLFLSLSIDTPIVRYLELPEVKRPIDIRGPIRILAIISSPVDHTPLDVEQEWWCLQESIADLIDQGQVVLERLEEPSLTALQRFLRRHETHIFHFIGHGAFDQEKQDGILLFEDDKRQGNRVSSQYLGTLLHNHHSLRLAVLNACEGARTSLQDPFSGVAQSLIQQGVPGVVAMQFEISDGAAIIFAREFYASMADGYSVETALVEARTAIFASGNQLEWGTPVHFSRSPDGHIFNLLPKPREGLAKKKKSLLHMLAPKELKKTALEDVVFKSEAGLRNWKLPPVREVLNEGKVVRYNDEYDRNRARLIEETLRSFGAPVWVVEINRGPVITQFGVEPDFINTRYGRRRVRISKIEGLEKELALALSKKEVRIQTSVPSAGYVGIEVPNDEIEKVALHDIIESSAFKAVSSPLTFALGMNVAGQPVAANLNAMPHLLIAGSINSGKSIFLNSLVGCLLLFNTPDTLSLVLIDPRRVELAGFNGVPHLLSPVIGEPELGAAVLKTVLQEAKERARKMAAVGDRNIESFNSRLIYRGEQPLSKLVVIIDEFADLMIQAPEEIERCISRLMQLARPTGIHLVIASQRSSPDVITDGIKANFSARIAFAVPSATESERILEKSGAERLFGRGDMLFKAPDVDVPMRIQSAFISDEEIRRLVYYWQSFSPPETAK